jgi:hypothetical protein
VGGTPNYIQKHVLMRQHQHLMPRALSAVIASSSIWASYKNCVCHKFIKTLIIVVGGFDQPCATFGLDKRVTSAKAYKNALCLALYNEEPPNGRGFGEDGWTYGDEASCMESGGSIESYPVYPTSPY